MTLSYAASTRAEGAPHLVGGGRDQETPHCAPSRRARCNRRDPREWRRSRGDVQRRVDEGGLRRGSPPSGAGAHAWQLDQLTASGMTQSSHASTKPPCCEPDVFAASW